MFDHEDELIDVLLSMEPIPEPSIELEANPELSTEHVSGREGPGGDSSSMKEESSSSDSSSNAGGSEDQGGETILKFRSTRSGSSGGRRRRLRKREQKSVKLQETLEEKYESLRKGKLKSVAPAVIQH